MSHKQHAHPIIKSTKINSITTKGSANPSIMKHYLQKLIFNSPIIMISYKLQTLRPLLHHFLKILPKKLISLHWVLIEANENNCSMYWIVIVGTKSSVTNIYEKVHWHLIIDDVRHSANHIIIYRLLAIWSFFRQKINKFELLIFILNYCTIKC